MKIIKQGKELNTKIERKFCCGICGCEYIAEQGEYYIETDEHGCIYFCSECPNCKSVMFVDANLSR